MNTLKRSALILTAFLCFGQLAAQEWKKMMNDPQVNVYDVIQAAEAYFETVDKDAKGSGWKTYQRWRFETEPKYYPTGDRSNRDPYFTSKAYTKFVRENPPSGRSVAGEKWQELGPYYIEQVTGHYSCGLGRVESFYIDPDNADRMYLGSRSGGFWKTLDGGQTWIGSSTDFLTACGVNTMTARPTNGDHVLINMRNSLNGVTHGIYRSTDAGDTWEETAFVPANLGWGGLGSNDYISKVEYHPTTPNLVFVASSRGLFRSADDLGSWTTPVSDKNFYEVHFHPTDPLTVYAVSSDTRSQVYVSKDGGLTFSLSGDIPGNTSTIRMSISAACPDCIFIGSSDGVWQSSDAGQTFSLISSPGIANYGAFGVSDVSTNYMLFGDIDTHMSDDGGQNFYRSTYWAEGNAFYNTTGTYVHADIRGVRCIDGVFWTNTDGFLCKSEDNGATWELFEGQSIRENYNLGVSQSNHYRTICGSQDNGTSIKTENSWVEFFGADGMEGIIHPLNGDWMIGSYQFGGRLRTKDGGQTLGYITPDGEEGNWIAPLMYDPNDQMVVYDFREYIYRSDDFGTTWTQLGSPGFDGAISFGAIAENNSNIMVATRGSAISLSTDGGNTFTDIRSNLPNFGLTDVAFDPNDDSTIIATNGRHQNNGQKVFITHDLGQNWINITHNLQNMPVRSVVIDHTKESNIYLGTEIGIYKKAMVDDSWTLYSDDLPNMTVRELEIMYGSNTLRAATWGRGLWENKLEGRADYPAIVVTRITDQPTEQLPLAGQDQFVTSTINYGDELSSAYVSWSVDTMTYANSIVMQRSDDSTWVSESPIPAQEEGSIVYFKVYAVGSQSDTSVTYKFMYETRPFDHCESFGNMAYATSITRVKFDEIDNVSGKTQPYTDYKAEHQASISVFPAKELTVNLNTDGDYSIFAKAWIDWNQDADFEDQDEEYDLGFARNTADGPTSLSPVLIVTPLHAKPGKTTMRVSCKYDDAPYHCETFFDGEVEDYTINVLPHFITQFDTVQICSADSVYLEGEWQNTSGDYVDTAVVDPLIYHVIQTRLDVYDVYPIPEVYAGCDVVVVPGLGEYYENADTSFLRAGNNGACDTMYNISVVVYETEETVLDESACNSYTSPSGEVYTESGTYINVLTAHTGCDSVITIHLEISEIDTSVSVIPPVLTAGAEGASYQWIDCETMEEIAGETGQSFTATTDGLYAVIVSNPNCVDTSACYQITGVSVIENAFGEELNYFPNPTSGRVFIDLGDQYRDVQTRIIAMDGRLVDFQEFDAERNLELEIDGPSGYYMINIIEATGKTALLQVFKN